jgi:P-type E1-E2 ATPase
MIEVSIPGYKSVQLEHLVLDYNGTIACDGNILPGVKKTLELLSAKLDIHVVTADTYGTARTALEGVPCKLTVLPSGGQAKAKLEYIQDLGVRSTACIGNGRNDRLMLDAAAIGIAVIQEEGASSQALKSSGIICNSITSALGLFTDPMRLAATLRS